MSAIDRLHIPHLRHTAEDAAPRTGEDAAAAEARHAETALAGLRLTTGFVFVWAFLDKTFGLGYATASENAWINGGSPTKGFLGNLAAGPFRETFQGWAGDAWADWLFMLGLLGIGVAVTAGVALRLAAVSGTVMMALMWVAEWPLARHTDAGELTMSNNPIVDYHVIYAAALIVVALTHAGDRLGFGKLWARIPFVERHRSLMK